MAKKKVSSHSHKDKPLQKEEVLVKPQQHHHQITSPMDSDDKFESLKSLNQMLLKEAFERRHLVDSLTQSKGDLESDLMRARSENDVFFSELTQLEIQRNVADLFVSLQLSQKGKVYDGEMKDLVREVRELKRVFAEKENEIQMLSGKIIETQAVLGNEREFSVRVCAERDELKDKLDGQIVEGERLRLKLIEMEEINRNMELEMVDLRAAYNGVVGEKEERDMKIESIMKEKDFVEKGLAELKELVDETNEELGRVVREKEERDMTIEAIMKEKDFTDKALAELKELVDEAKEELNRVVSEKESIEEKKNVEMDKRCELENAVKGLNEMVASFREEERKLRVIVAELEKKSYQGEEKQKEMAREIGELVEDRKLIGKRFEGLILEKDVVEKNLGEALKQLETERQGTEDLVKEKVSMIEAKDRLDHEVDTLKNQVADLKAVILKMEKSNMVNAGKIESLESEVEDHVHNLDLIKVERDEIRKCLDKEEQNVLRLKDQIEDMEKKIEESLKVLEERKAENGALLVQKIEVEGQCEGLKRVISCLENSLNEAHKEFTSMKDKFESADAKKGMVLKMLKETVAFCSKDDKELLGSKVIVDEETNPCEIEFEIIKNAFKGKETEVEYMKRQLELLQNSVNKANKKSFWTAVSSATALLAALAYVARRIDG